MERNKKVGEVKIMPVLKFKCKESWNRVFEHVREMYSEAEDADIIRLIGKAPTE